MDSDIHRGWMHLWPDAAALVAGAVALIIRASNTGEHRKWRAVVADATGTVALGYSVYVGVESVTSIEGVAFASAVFAGACGWEWVRRRFATWANSKVGGDAGK